MVDNRDDHWSNRPSVYWAGFGVVFVFFTSFMIDWGWVTPAWVQAIGTLLALAIAIYVPRRIHGREAKERADDQRRQGQGIALLIGHTLRTLEGEIHRTINKIDRIIKKGEPVKFQEMVIDIPQLIQAEVNRLWLMGPAGDRILHVVSTLEATHAIGQRRA